ncbi:MAG: glycoside hydrolase family 43 protein [Kiritimatiellae bacterium]|nr:glycoside hydrolase family 43 protein [Kiritimatiellia bacterium]
MHAHHQSLSRTHLAHPSRGVRRLRVAVAALLTHALAGAEPPPATYRNPLPGLEGLADPFVLRHHDRYLLYATGDARSYPVFESTDLVRWRRLGDCWSDPRGGLWAPEVLAAPDGRFYLYYTVNAHSGATGLRKTIGVATADRPEGPFREPMDLVARAIDAHPFLDQDGRLYLYYADLAQGFRIMVRPMADPRRPAGEAVELLRPTEPWETAYGRVTEGPFVIRRGPTYYLMYSGSGADSPHYAIGYATADSPLGPFRKHPRNPIARSGNGVLGPGHHCVVRGPDEGWWMFYHQKFDDGINFRRFLALDPLVFEADGALRVEVSRNRDRPAPTSKGRPSSVTAGHPPAAPSRPDAKAAPSPAPSGQH